MKKFLSIIIALIMLISLCACNSEQPNDTQETQSNNQIQETTNQENNESQIEHNDLDEEWGVETGYLVTKGYDTYDVNIRFPSGNPSLKGMMAGYYSNKTICLAGGQSSYDNYGIEKPEEVFPNCFGYVTSTLQNILNTWDTEYTYEVNEKKNQKINDYEMCVFEGVMNVTEDGQSRQCAYVAYATFLKVGAYAYWIVIDDTQDQSMGEVIADYAEKMAKSMYES